jgi:aminoglycoside phosphotransferase (APT) family kinase protein
VDLLASGRMAEVFAWADGRVLKLDRVEWNGVSALEMLVLETVTAAGVPAPRPYETVMVDDRHGVVMDRVDGPMLSTVIADAADLEVLANMWTEMHGALNARVVAGLPDLVTSIADGIKSSGLAPTVVEESLELLATIDDGERVLCHFDLHPGNVIVGGDGWVVIDWLTASTGPPAADLARTLVLDPPGSKSPKERFMAHVARQGMTTRRLDQARLDAWVRVIAAARISEGFEGEYADFLTDLASGARRLDE